MPPKLKLSKIPPLVIHLPNLTATVKFEGELTISRIGVLSQWKLSEKGPSAGLATEDSEVNLSKEGVDLRKDIPIAHGFVDLLATMKPEFNPFTRTLNFSWGISTVVKKGGSILYTNSTELTLDGAVRFTHKAGPIWVEHGGFKFEGTFGFAIELRPEFHTPPPGRSPDWVPGWLVAIGVSIGVFVIRHPRLTAWTLEVQEAAEGLEALEVFDLPPV